jgi:adenylate cyclase
MLSKMPGFQMFLFYNLIPVISNALILIASNLVIGSLLYDAANFQVFREVIMKDPVNNFLVNILPFPMIMGVLFYLSYPAYKIFSRNKEHMHYTLGLRRMLNAPFNIGIFSFGGWLLGNMIARSVYAFGGISQSGIVVFRVVGISVVSGLLSFVMNYYLVTLVNRKFYYPHFFPDGGLKDIPGVRKLSLRFNLEIFVLAVATSPILVLGLSLLNLQGLVEPHNRPPYATSVGLIIGLVLLGVFMSFLLARSLRNPIVRMRNAAQLIQQGNYQIKLPVDTTDEIGDLAESINEMATGLDEKERIKDTFGRAVDPRVRDYLLSAENVSGGSEVEATILFSDIRGFTSFSEKHSAPEVVAWLNVYFERMAQCVRDHGGIVNKYVGDAILAVFNAPLALDDHAQAAVNCAVAMLDSLAELNRALKEQAVEEVKIGIGIHTGMVVAGNIGSRDRQEYTVIGDTVNTASRIEGLCKKIQVPLLMSEQVYDKLKKSHNIKKIGRVKVKGKEKYVTIFGL